MQVTVWDGVKEYFQGIEAYVVGNPHPDLGPYVQMLKILYDVGSCVCSIPVRLTYDQEKKLYVVKSCHVLQRILCGFVQIAATFSIINRLMHAGSTVMENKASIVAYFDFANETVLNIFIFWHFYLHWFEPWRLQKYADALQTTTLLRFNHTPTWKAKIFPVTYWTLGVIMTTTWTRVVHGVDFSSYESILKTGGANAREIYWLSEDTNIPLPWCVMGIVSRFFNAFFHHSILNIFASTSAMPVYFIGMDFYDSILKENIPPIDVLDYYEEYKEVIGVANNYAATYVLHYTLMVLTFFSVHLFDTLNTTDFWWKLNMYMYDMEIGLILYFPTKVLINGKKLKKWLWKDSNFMKIPKANLVLLLHEMIPWIPRKGLRAGRYLVISAEYTGAVISNMWSYSMLVTLSAK